MLSFFLVLFGTVALSVWTAEAEAAWEAEQARNYCPICGAEMLKSDKHCIICGETNPKYVDPDATVVEPQKEEPVIKEEKEPEPWLGKLLHKLSLKVNRRDS